MSDVLLGAILAVLCAIWWGLKDILDVLDHHDKPWLFQQDDKDWLDKPGEREEVMKTFTGTITKQDMLKEIEKHRKADQICRGLMAKVRAKTGRAVPSAALSTPSMP